MRYLALACDYDGTLATDARVDEPTLAALERLRATGRRLLLVTGRELPDLLQIFPHVNFFERVVAENGALLYRPVTREERILAEAPPEPFVRLLHQRGVTPLSQGRVIVATWQPHETAVLGAIRDLGLELQVIFNKGAVMVLPAGVNKATGLAAALTELGLSAHNVVGIGDAENDHAFLSLCECSVAVANALPMVKNLADLVTKADHGAGVAELIEHLLTDDLRAAEGRLTRHQILLGQNEAGDQVRLRPYGINVLIAGPSGSGKSTAAASLLDRLAEQKYQFCIIDPEGDYENYEGAVTLGDSKRGPRVEEVLQHLKSPDANAVVNLVGLPLADRPPFFQELLSRLQEMRARIGRPHWLIVDEAHHLLPASWEPVGVTLPQAIDRLVFITVHPDGISPTVLARVDTLIAVGQSPETTVRQFCQALREDPPLVTGAALKTGQVLFWSKGSGTPPFPVRVAQSRTERRRHTRKYTEGELPPDRSFYFRGPEGKLNLRAQNVILFMQLADGVDDDTWMHHLRRGDYSAWFREKIKDEALAAEVQRVEALAEVSPAESRRQVKAAIEKHYTLPASAPLRPPDTNTPPPRT